jgi:hypothetical protein
MAIAGTHKTSFNLIDPTADCHHDDKRRAAEIAELAEK